MSQPATSATAATATSAQFTATMCPSRIVDPFQAARPAGGRRLADQV